MADAQTLMASEDVVLQVCHSVFISMCYKSIVHLKTFTLHKAVISMGGGGGGV